MHHYLPCCDGLYVRADDEQPHDENEDAHDAANPLDTFALQYITYIDDRDGESSVRKDHCPPAIVSFQDSPS